MLTHLGQVREGKREDEKERVTERGSGEEEIERGTFRCSCLLIVGMVRAVQLWSGGKGLVGHSQQTAGSQCTNVPDNGVWLHLPNVMCCPLCCVSEGHVTAATTVYQEESLP